MSKIVEVLEVNFEKTYLFLNVLENSFVIPIIFKVIVKKDEKMLV